MKLARMLAIPLAAAICPAAWGHPHREAARVELPFETTKEQSLMIVRVSLGGKTGDFLFDTGNEITLVDREFAGFPSEKRGKGELGEIAVEWVKLGPLCLGKYCFEKRTVGVAELGIFPRLGRRIDGIVGQDLLREFDEVTINYKKSTVTLIIEGDAK